MAETMVSGREIEDYSITEADLNLADVTTGNADITKHGFMPKLPNDANKFPNGVGNWVTIEAMGKPIISSMTFSPANWTLVGSLYQAFVTVTGVTTNHACYAFVDFGSEQNALDAKLSHLVGCTANKVTFYSATLPTGDISLVMHIYDVGGYTKGGVFLPMGPSVPSQTNNAGKFLTTNGTTMGWAMPSVSSQPPVDHSPSAGATETLDLNAGNQHNIALPVGAVTLALSNATVGKKFIVTITQNASTGGTVTWFSTIRWAMGLAPAISTAASKRDTFAFICTGSGTYDGFIIGQGA